MTLPISERSRDSSFSRFFSLGRCDGQVGEDVDPVTGGAGGGGRRFFFFRPLSPRGVRVWSREGYCGFSDKDKERSK